MGAYVVTLKGGRKVEVESASPDPVAIQAKIAAGAYKDLPTLTAAQRLVRSSAPSIMGGAIGATVGGLAAPVTGGLSIPIGAALGAAGGEAVQQLTDPFRSGADTSQPSWLQTGLAGAASLAGPALGVARRATNIPAVQTALSAVVGKSGERLIELFAPAAGTVKRLFAQATQSGRQATVGTSKLSITLQEVVTDLSKSELKPNAAVKEAVEGVAVLIQRAGARQGGGIPWDRLRATMSDVGDRIGQLQRTGNDKAAEKVKRLYGAMWDEIETAGASAAGPLREAVDAFKRERAGEFLSGAFKKGGGVSGAGEDLMNVRAVLDRVNKNGDLLKRMLPEEDVAEIKATLQRFAQIENRPREAASAVSNLPGILSAAGMGTAAGTAVGAGIGGGPGGAIGGALGLAAGAQVPRLTTGAHAIGSMLLSAPGRAVLGQLADQGVLWDQLIPAAAQAIRSEPAAALEVGVEGVAGAASGLTSFFGGGPSAR